MPPAQPPARTDLGQRPQQPQGAAARALRDAGADQHHPQARILRGCARGLPADDHVGQEAVSARAVLGEEFAAAARAVVTDRRRGDHDGRAAGRGDGKLGEPAAGVIRLARMDRL